ncbi:MAG: TetR/AcrR family transcriptional regulator [Solirubrobacteraceae bacterium]|nr:TetR/AcrR family transcriptional regulator [Solirubrobacteraceae bacterium]
MTAADAPAPDGAAATRPTPRGRVPPAERDEQVLGLARELFVERGYVQASMDEIARRAGVSKPMIYELVGSKEALYDRCVERAGEELALVITEAVQSTDDPLSRIRAGAIAFLNHVAERGGGWDLLLTSGPEPGDEPIWRIRRQQAELLTRLTAETVADLGVELEPWRIEAMAHAVNSAFEGLAFWWRQARDVSAEELVDWMATLVVPGLVALAQRPDPAD